VVSKEDDAWRAIIDNYGDRPEIEDDTDPAVDTAPERSPAPEPEPAAGWDDAFPDSDWSTDRFIPPPPPPLPAPTTDRLIAWLGVFGSPVVLLVCLVFGIDLPQLLAYLLVGSFVGGFLYLVAQMPRGPRDPNDDGAQV
jgi:hypothetical protein